MISFLKPGNSLQMSFTGITIICFIKQLREPRVLGFSSCFACKGCGAYDASGVRIEYVRVSVVQVENMSPERIHVTHP